MENDFFELPVGDDYKKFKFKQSIWGEKTFISTTPSMLEELLFRKRVFANFIQKTTSVSIKYNNTKGN